MYIVQMNDITSLPNLTNALLFKTAHSEHAILRKVESTVSKYFMSAFRTPRLDKASDVSPRGTINCPLYAESSPCCY